MAASDRHALGGVGLIILCFFGSAALRLTDNGWAFAQGVGEVAAPGNSPPRPGATPSSPRFASASPSSTPPRPGWPTAGRP